MVVVLPICRKDSDAALRNLAWLLELDPAPSPFTCLVSHESGLAEAAAVLSAARRCFSDVRELLYLPYHGPSQWPRPQNYAFRSAATFMAKRPGGEPWLWWEQDAVPLRAGAFALLASEYATCAKPFMGALGASDGLNASHLNGVAIYPADACRRAPSLLAAGALPFDVAGGMRVLSQSHLTALIQHVWSWDGPRGSTPTFPGASSLSQLSHNAVLFHRCKDASLIARLRERGPCAQAAPRPTGASALEARDITIVITSYQRPEFLREAFQSCVRAGMTRVVVSSSGATGAVKAIHAEILASHPSVTILSEDGDSGSNSNWLRGIEAARTEWVQILHDDDRLLPHYGAVRQHLGLAPFICWDAMQHGSQSGLCRVFGFDYGRKPASLLLADLLKERLSPSPVAGCFQRAHLLQTLKECQRWGPEFYYRDKLLVGNDLLIWIRAAQRYADFRYLPTPLTSFGNHPGSATVSASSTRDKRLMQIYNRVRAYCQNGATPGARKLALPMVTLLGVDTWRPIRTLRALRAASAIADFADVALVTTPAAKAHLKGITVLDLIATDIRMERERFLMTRLTETFSTSHCLHMEADAAIRNPAAWDPAWLSYDYIGAPWVYPRTFHGRYAVTPECCVGNLGFALVSKKLAGLLAALPPPSDAQAQISDVHLCIGMRPALEKQGIRFAPEAVAAKFSCEGRACTGQFGWHGHITAEMNGFDL